MVLRMELVLLWQVHAWVCRALMGKHRYLLTPHTPFSSLRMRTGVPLRMYEGCSAWLGKCWEAPQNLLALG